MQQPLHVLGTGCAALGLLFLLIALATPGWMQGKGLNYGLFRLCSQETDECRTFSPTGSEAAVRFFVVVGFLLALTATAVSIFYFIKFVLKDVPNRILPIVASLELVIAGGAIILGCIIFGAKVRDSYEDTVVPDTLSYSFGLAIAGALLCLGAAGMIMMQLNRGGSLS